MTSDKKSGEIIDFGGAGNQADKRRDARRDAKAAGLQQRFAAARRAAEPKSRAAERLKKLFKKPPSRS
jgi:hypothetical protein